jgi:lipoprotein-anchoring transpeptidase ErfK/SrfK
VWLVEDDGYVYQSYLVSGRAGVPNPGTYHVFRKINPGMSGSLRLPYFVGFAYGSTTDIGFHGIPLRPDGSPIEPDSLLGTYQSHGCVRENQTMARLLWDWTPIGTTVVVLP